MNSTLDLVDPPSLRDYLSAVGLDVEDATPTYIRYKPGTGAVVSVDLVHQGATHRAYLRRAIDSTRAAEVVAKALTMKPMATELGASVRQLDSHTTLFLFPTDAKLRRLRWVASGRKIRWLVADTFDDGPYCGDASSISVLRYKPERRLVGRAVLVPKRGGATRSFVYRLAVDTGVTQLAAINQAARNAGIATPRPIATLQAGRFHLEEALDAIPLVDAVVAGWSDAAALAATMEQIGEVAAVGLDVVTPAEDLAMVRRSLAAIGGYHAQLVEEIAVLERALVTNCPDGVPTAATHGDLHLGQFMVNDGALYLVDWERAAVGHRARDIGRVLAHPYALSVRRDDLPVAALASLVTAAVEGYRSRVRLLDRDLGFYLAVAFVDQALLVSRHLEPDSGRRAALLIELAIGTVSRGTSGLRLSVRC